MLDGEKRGTRKKEGRGGRRDDEEGGTGRKEGRGERKNKKVAKGRIIGLAGPCFSIFLSLSVQQRWIP